MKKFFNTDNFNSIVHYNGIIELIFVVILQKRGVMYNKKIPVDLNCGFRIALEVFGSKWKPYIIYELIDKSLRPSEIARLLPEASERVINQQLKELMLYGVIEKKIINTQNKHSEYSLTELGRSLLPIIDAMRDWGNDFKPTLQQIIDKATIDKTL